MNIGKVAVPYYGHLHRPKMGYERVYFIVDADGTQEKGLDVRLGVWDHRKEPALPDWLKNNGIASLVCREEPEMRLMKRLVALGIRILDGNNSAASSLMQQLMV